MVEEGRRWVSEEGFTVREATLGAGGLVPVTDLEGILRLGRGFRVVREEAREETSGECWIPRRKRVDGKVPVV